MIFKLSFVDAGTDICLTHTFISLSQFSR